MNTFTPEQPGSEFQLRQILHLARVPPMKTPRSRNASAVAAATRH